MNKQAPATGFSASERHYIRRELDMFFCGAEGSVTSAGCWPGCKIPASQGLDRHLPGISPFLRMPLSFRQPF
jgi:hypothetical protein